MDEKRRVKVSKYLSRHLRHDPQRLGLTLQLGGWVPVADLLAAMARHNMTLSRADLDEIVQTSDKQRYSYSEDGTLIRANQGHSVPVDLQLTPRVPPDVLYHGTARHLMEAIRRDGLLKMSRHHVHLSLDRQTARVVGARHGHPLVWAVDAAGMQRDGHLFYCSANGVWLVEHVPPGYLREA